MVGIDKNSGHPIVINPNIPCMKCEMCRRGLYNLCSKETAIGTTVDGGLKGNLSVPNANIFSLDKLDKKYDFCDPLAVILHGLSLVKLRKKNSILILGDGSLAKLLIWYLNRIGFVPSISRRHADYPLQNLHIAEEYKLNNVNTHKYDIVFDCTGFRQDTAINYGISHVVPRGCFLCYGVYPLDYATSFNLRSLFEHEVIIQGVRSFLPQDFNRAINIMSSIDFLNLDFLTIKVLTVDRIKEINQSIFTRGIDKVIIDMSVS